MFISDRRDAGQTLGAVLRARYNLTWSKAKATIERRHVRVAGQIVADASFRVKSGKRISIAIGAIETPAEKKAAAAKKITNPAVVPDAKVKAKTPAIPKPEPKKPVRVLPSEMPDIVYSDDSVVVVNKPAGLTTMRHKDEAEEFGKGQRFLPKTAADLLPGLLGTPSQKLIAVHRIDRDTSGLVVFARTAGAAKMLEQQFRKHTVERKYLALVRGTPKPGRIISTIADDRGDGRRGAGEVGKKAVTSVSVKATWGEFALVECRLETGRTHQVRIHLGEVGTPLCGETVYDRPLNGKPYADGSGAKRVMLHAATLGFIHPESGEALRWEVPPPRDFLTLQTKLSTI
ncbi:RluA family pseudouridine synthase [soil metagenome]